MWRLASCKRLTTANISLPIEKGIQVPPFVLLCLFVWSQEIWGRFS